jgi:hypothetical protein
MHLLDPQRTATLLVEQFGKKDAAQIAQRQIERARRAGDSWDEARWLRIEAAISCFGPVVEDS